MHHQRDGGNNAHEQGGKPINHEAYFHAKASDAHPLVKRLVVMRPTAYLKQHKSRERKRQAHGSNAQPVRSLVPKPIAASSRTKNTNHRRRAQRDEQNSQQEGERKCVHHLF